MNEPYIFESNKNSGFDGNEAIIVLPDIYSQSGYSKRTAEDFAENFKRPVFLLDYFFISTKEANSWSDNDSEKAHLALQNFKGDEFVDFFQKVLAEIKVAYPKIEKFIVIGFCFGGRLAYIAGGETSISKVISFYGGGANTANYVDGKTPIEYLVSKKSGSDLSVTSFFGTADQSIPEADREKIKAEMEKGNIAYNSYEYDAGHAYFQEGRKNYDPKASHSSWEVLRKVLQ